MQSQNFPKWLQIVYQRYTKLLDKNLAAHDLTSSLYYYIIKLYEFGDLQQDEIVKLTGVNASNVTRAINKLVAMNLVFKKRSTEDRRGFLLSLTKDGVALYPLVIECVEKTNRTFFNEVTPNEKEEIISIIGKLADDSRGKL